MLLSSFIIYSSFFTGFCFLIFFIVHLFKQSLLKASNVILGSFFIVLAGCCFANTYKIYAYVTNSEVLMAFYIPIDFLFFMLIGPTSYLYVREILQKRKKRILTCLFVHLSTLLPAVIVIAYFMYLPVNERIAIVLYNRDAMHWVFKLLLGLFLVQVLVYVLISHLQLRNHIKKHNRLRVKSVEVEVEWLKPFFTFMISGIVFSFFACYGMNSDYYTMIHGLLFMHVLFFYFFIKTSWNNGIFNELEIIYNIEHGGNETEKTNDTSSFMLPPNRAMQVIDKLSNSIIGDKLYLNAEITILDVANHLKFPVHHISNALNQHLKTNFTDYINSLRLEEAKRLLQNPDNKFTIEYIGLECGFGSKSSFNRFFKKIEGITPSEFKKNIYEFEYQ